jgi:aspartate/methionine/tyrosine aminotransferase
MYSLIDFYKENAAILRETFESLGFSVYGGVNAPYVWVGFPGQPSWNVFAEILKKCDIVTTPGSGFGPAGEGFVRASAFGHRYEQRRIHFMRRTRICVRNCAFDLFDSHVTIVSLVQRRYLGGCGAVQEGVQLISTFRVHC